jgi:DNA adenine methylase
MVISVNDIPEMRAIFNGLSLQTTDINYTAGGAGKTAKRSELIIMNF